MAADDSARPGSTSVPSAPAAVSPFAPAATILEGFDTVAAGCVAGWVCTNNSAPVGTTGWFQGNPAVFPAQAGATNAYIGANFNNVAGNNTISNWLISPQVQFGTGSELRFWSRRGTASPYPDRVEIRLSATGTNTGGTATSTGDFSVLLGTINPALSATPGTCASPAGPPNAGGYPNDWCEYRLTTTEGIPLSGSGRIAFRYFVTSGGPTGANSDYIGIDTFSFVEGVSNAPPVFAYTPAAASTVTFTGGGAVGSTGNASIAVSIATAGAGTGAAATTTTTCTAPTSPFAGFGQTVTAVGAGAVSGSPLSGTCTLAAAAATQTLTCSENRGGTPTAVTFTLSCPAGVVPLTSTPASGATITLSNATPGGPATTSTIQFQNPRTTSATVTCTAPTGTGFTAAPLSITVPASGNATTTISFSGTTIGSYTGTFSCTSGAQTFNFNLAGQIAQTVAVPAIGDQGRWLMALLLLGFGLVAVAVRRK